MMLPAHVRRHADMARSVFLRADWPCAMPMHINGSSVTSSQLELSVKFVQPGELRNLHPTSGRSGRPAEKQDQRPGIVMVGPRVPLEATARRTSAYMTA